jgi:type IV pilus assembly protein PilC
MKFRVVVRQENGAETKRIIEAPSRIDAYKLIEREGAKVRSLQEGTGLMLPHWMTAPIGQRVKRQEIITMAKNLAAMLGAGLSLSRALSVVERQSSNIRFRSIVAEVEQSVRSGVSFHEALAAHEAVFSSLFVAMMRAGEESGSLTEALKVVAVQMERSESLSRKIRGAMIYPAIVLCAVVVVGILMMIYVVPTLVATFVSLKAQLPLATRVIIAISNFMVANIALVLVGIVVFIVALYYALRSRTGKAILLWIALRLPAIGQLVQETYAARTARTISSLLAAGVPVLEALAIAREVVSAPFYAPVLAEAEENVKKGEAMSIAFVAHPKLYPILMSDMAVVGEETGKSAEMLGQVAAFYEEDVEERTKDLSTIIEPIMVLVIGVAVGIFAISMIAPIYSLSSAF